MIKEIIIMIIITIKKIIITKESQKFPQNLFK